MDADKLIEAIRNFLNELGTSGSEVAAGMRSRALGFAEDAGNLTATTFKSVEDKFHEFQAYAGQLSNDIHDAFSENDLYVIMTALLQSLSVLVRSMMGDGNATST